MPGYDQGGGSDVAAMDARITKELVYRVVEREVHERLGNFLSREVADLIKKSSLDDTDKTVARLLVGENMKKACESFFQKMEGRDKARAADPPIVIRPREPGNPEE